MKVINYKPLKHILEDFQRGIISRSQFIILWKWEQKMQGLKK